MAQIWEYIKIAVMNIKTKKVVLKKNNLFLFVLVKKLVNYINI